MAGVCGPPTSENIIQPSENRTGQVKVLSLLARMATEKKVYVREMMTTQYENNIVEKQEIEGREKTQMMMHPPRQEATSTEDFTVPENTNIECKLKPEPVSAEIAYKPDEVSRENGYRSGPFSGFCKLDAVTREINCKPDLISTREKLYPISSNLTYKPDLVSITFNGKPDLESPKNSLKPDRNGGQAAGLRMSRESEVKPDDSSSMSSRSCAYNVKSQTDFLMEQLEQQLSDLQLIRGLGETTTRQATDEPDGLLPLHGDSGTVPVPHPWQTPVPGPLLSNQTSGISVSASTSGQNIHPQQKWTPPDQPWIQIHQDWISPLETWTQPQQQQVQPDQLQIQSQQQQVQPDQLQIQAHQQQIQPDQLQIQAQQQQVQPDQWQIQAQQQQVQPCQQQTLFPDKNNNRRSLRDSLLQANTARMTRHRSLFPNSSVNGAQDLPPFANGCDGSYQPGCEMGQRYLQNVATYRRSYQHDERVGQRSYQLHDGTLGQYTPIMMDSSLLPASNASASPGVNSYDAPFLPPMSSFLETSQSHFVPVGPPRLSSSSLSLSSSSLSSSSASSVGVVNAVGPPSSSSMLWNLDSDDLVTDDAPVSQPGHSMMPPYHAQIQKLTDGPSMEVDSYPALQKQLELGDGGVLMRKRQTVEDIKQELKANKFEMREAAVNGTVEGDRTMNPNGGRMQGGQDSPARGGPFLVDQQSQQSKIQIQKVSPQINNVWQGAQNVEGKDEQQRDSSPHDGQLVEQTGAGREENYHRGGWREQAVEGQEHHQRGPAQHGWPSHGTGVVEHRDDTSLMCQLTHCDEDGDTPLHHIPGCDRQIFYSYFQLFGQDVNFRQAMNTRNGLLQTPLYCCVLYRNHDAARCYLPYADPNIQGGQVDNDTKEMTEQGPIHKAVEMGDAEMVHVLLQSPRLDLSAERSSDRKSALMVALQLHVHGCPQQDRTQIIKLLVDKLIEEEIDLSKVNPCGDRSVLMYAIESKDVGVVKYILNRAGLDQARDLINSRNKDGNTSMHIMAGLKNISPGDHVSLGCVLLKYGGLQIRNRENEMTPADFNGPLFTEITRSFKR